jgi:hypothetical protein
MEYKNNEELYFSYYLDELREHKFIRGYTYELDTFELSEDVEFTYTKTTELKTKTKVETKTKSLLKPCTYTPDFVITFSDDIKGFCSTVDTLPIFILSGKDNKGYIDVKGMFAGRTNSTQYTFPLKQKWIYQRHGIYTNKIVPYKLFEQTFTPQKVLDAEVYKRDIPKRGIKMGDTKLKHKITTIKEWLKINQFKK